MRARQIDAGWEDSMHKFAFAAAALAFASTSIVLTLPATSADAPAVERKVLMQQDAPGGNTLSMVQVTIPVGGREGKHTHPGPLMVHVISGAFSLDYEGKPNITYTAGQDFYVEANHVHEGINRGSVPAVGIAAFVTPKGAPLTKQQ
jgi:quercetin dioxygenase-like cupin family protein